MLQDKKESCLTETETLDSNIPLFSFDNLFESSLDAQAVFSKGKIVAINPKACAMFGYTKAEMLRPDIIDRIVPQDHIFAMINNINSRSSHSYILDARRKSGEVISVGIETNHMFYVNENYRICTFCNLSTVSSIKKDTTSLSKAMLYPANSILGQKEKFELLFNVSFNAFAIHVDGCILEINQMFMQLYGYTKSELLGADIFQIGFPDPKDRMEYKELLKRKPHTRVIMSQVCKDGTTFDAEVRGDYGVINGQKVRVVTVKDISDLVKSETQLLESNKQLVEKNHELQLVSEEVISSRQTFYKTLVEESDNINANVLEDVIIYGSFEYDIITRQMILSDEVKDILDIQSVLPSLPEREVLTKIVPADLCKLNDSIDKTISSRSLLKVEVAINISDVNRKYVLIQGIVQHASDNVACRISGTVLDVTERKRIEDRLRTQNDHYLQLNEELIVARKKAEDSERLKTSFFSNMSHEIRTPMNGILGFSGLLLDKDLPVDERMEYAKVITDSGKRLLHIVNDILDISKLESDTVKIVKTNVNVNELLVKLLRLFNKEQSVVSGDVVLKLFKGLDDSDCVIKTDDTRLNQILFNLLSNALKFTKSGSVSFGCTQNDDMLRFYVKDTGIGIPDEMQEKVFEPFRQVEGHLVKQHGGTGLGLSISRKLAALLGGKLTLESKEGEGATFSAFLPYDRAFPSKKKPKSLVAALEDSSSTKTCLKLLLAEDDDVNFLFFKSFLQRRVTLVRAKTGVEAVEMVFSDPDIDIVLMDVKMPEMNGLDAIKKIRTEYPLLPIIVQTAYAMEGDRKTALDAGANDYVSKPINRRLLMKKIEDLCNS